MGKPPPRNPNKGFGNVRGIQARRGGQIQRNIHRNAKERRETIQKLENEKNNKQAEVRALIRRGLSENDPIVQNKKKYIRRLDLDIENLR